jgi:arylsulfatase
MDEMKHFNLMHEDLDAALERLDDIGGPESHSNIPWGWAQAGNTPLKWYKQNTHGGGVRDPLIVRWPRRISDPGAIRHQFCHAVDVTPTILEAAGIGSPKVVGGIEQMPMHGASLLSTFADPAAPRPREVQYFEMVGHRGIWRDGWKAVTHHVQGRPFDQDAWELYHLDEDVSETNDLAAAQPERLKEMIDLWWAEAEANGTLPLDDRGFFELFRASRRPGLPSSRRHFLYRPPISHLVSDACPPVMRGWRTRIDLHHPEGAEGALVARGSLNSGFVIYIKGGRCVFDYNAFHAHSTLTAPIDSGDRQIELVVERQADGVGLAELLVDGESRAKGSIGRMLLIISSLGMDIGRSPRPVCPDYAAPFVYPGLIRSVAFVIPDLSAMLGGTAARAEATAAMSRQ